jgi:hypothetical protein
MLLSVWVFVVLAVATLCSAGGWLAIGLARKRAGCACGASRYS